ncbi:SapC family protein [Colwellia sp. MEBiC06753]
MNHALVNNVEHKDLRIITKRSAELGDNLWYALTFPQEFRSAQIHYPLFFTKDASTGEFAAVALFGFKENENLFLDENGWHASYIPASVLRHPFLIATQTVTENGEEKQNRMLSIDLDSPRISKEQGEPLFLPFGGNSDYLDRTASMLEALHLGATDGVKFCQQMAELALIEPCSLDIKLDNGQEHQMIGFYTINEDKFNALPIDTIESLRATGYLQAIYMMLASQGNIRTLLREKNKRVALATNQ